MAMIEWKRDDGTGLSVDVPEAGEHYWMRLGFALDVLVKGALQEGCMPEDVPSDTDVSVRIEALRLAEVASLAEEP